MDAELVVTPPGCSHLSSFKVDNWKQNLRAIYQCFVWSGTAEARKRKVTPRPASLRPGTAGWAGGRGPEETPLFAALPGTRGRGCFWALWGARGRG